VRDFVPFLFFGQKVFADDNIDDASTDAFPG
jgi:hypothetical protein